MSVVAPIEEMLQRVEQMLDALYVSDQSSKDFMDGCDQLERYLTDQKHPFGRRRAIRVAQEPCGGHH